MSILLSYKPLFELKIMHSYYLNKRVTQVSGPTSSNIEHYFECLSSEEQLKFLSTDQSVFDIKPSHETAELLKQLGCLAKVDKNRLVVAAKSDGTSSELPLFTFPANTVLSFHLYIKDTSFFEATSLADTNLSGGNVFYFDNYLTNGKSFPYLSKAYPFMTSGRVYRPGDMIVRSSRLYIAKQRATGTASGTPSATSWYREENPLPSSAHVAATTYAAGTCVIRSNNLYRALTSTNSTPSSSNSTPPLVKSNPAALWLNLGPLPYQYVHQSDLLPISSKNYYPGIALPNGASITLTIRQRSGNSNTAPTNGDVVFTETQVSPSNGFKPVFDLKHLPDGKYSVAYTTTTGVVFSATDTYIVEAAGRIWGVVEISCNSGSGDFNLFDGAGKFRSPIFQLRFKNRLTFWKYRSKSTASTLYNSKDAQPLLQNGIYSVVPDDGAPTVNRVDVPNPSVRQVKPEKDATNEIIKYISEIFIS